MLARHDVAVAHNPVANMLLGNGVCPVPRLRSEGITIAIGTDGAASNDNQDMFGVLKTAGLLHKVNTIDPAVITRREVLAMATLGGARALGIDYVTGSLRPASAPTWCCSTATRRSWRRSTTPAAGRLLRDRPLRERRLGRRLRRVAAGAVRGVDVRALAARGASGRRRSRPPRRHRRASRSTPATGGRSATGPPADAGCDVVVIGAGHNGLACGCYLARAGLDTVVVERRPEPGGCIVTEQLPSGAGRLELGALSTVASAPAASTRTSSSSGASGSSGCSPRS